MAQQVYQLDWFATNETVKYPIDSLATFIPTGYTELPAGLTGVITDISFAIPCTLTGVPYLSALSITDDLLTLIICIQRRPIFAFSITQRSLYVNRYYNLTSFVEGCSGVVVFGSSAKTHRCAYRFASEAESGFLPSVYHRYSIFPVTSIGRIGNATACTGDVVFRGVGDVLVATDTISVGGQRTKALLFGLNKDEDVNVLIKYIGLCDGRPESETCRRTSIMSINSLAPKDGNINIIGVNLDVDTSEGKMTFRSDYKLQDICGGNQVQTVEDQCDERILEVINEGDAVDSSSSLLSPCQKPIRKLNFNKDVYGSGISISGGGVSSISGLVQLDIPVLSDIYYFGCRITRPGVDGLFKVSLDGGTSEYTIDNTHARSKTGIDVSMLNSDTHTYPSRISLSFDHCNGIITVRGGNGDTYFSVNTNTDKINSIAIELADCTLEYGEYR